MIFELKEQRRKKAKPETGKEELTGIHLVTKPCVVKIHTGTRYIILKCMNLAGTIKSIHKVLRQWERGGKIGEENHYYFLVKYITKTNQENGTIEILEESKEAYKLLVREQTELDLARHDTNRLNSNLEAYVPLYNDLTGLYGWIPKPDVLRFHAWAKRRKKPKPA